MRVRLKARDGTDCPKGRRNYLFPPKSPVEGRGSAAFFGMLLVFLVLLAHGMPALLWRHYMNAPWLKRAWSSSASTVRIRSGDKLGIVLTAFACGPGELLRRSSRRAGR